MFCPVNRPIAFQEHWVSSADTFLIQTFLLSSQQTGTCSLLEDYKIKRSCVNVSTPVFAGAGSPPAQLWLSPELPSLLLCVGPHPSSAAPRP